VATTVRHGDDAILRSRWLRASRFLPSNDGDRTRIAYVTPACDPRDPGDRWSPRSISPSGSVSVQSGGRNRSRSRRMPGYVIASVLVDSTEVGPVTSYSFTHVTRNHTIAARLLDADDDPGDRGPHGSISPSGSVSVQSGGTQSFTITPDAGYVIASVLVDSTDVGPVTSYTFTHVTRNHTIAASFSTPTILASAGPHGSIDPSGTVTVPSGGRRRSTITPDQGYAIGSVVVDGVDVGRVASYSSPT